MINASFAVILVLLTAALLGVLWSPAVIAAWRRKKHHPVSRSLLCQVLFVELGAAIAFIYFLDAEEPNDPNGYKFLCIIVVGLLGAFAYLMLEQRKERLGSAKTVTSTEMEAFLQDPSNYYGTKRQVVPPELAEAFLRNPVNFYGKWINEIFQILGEPQDYDDWDFGRRVYNWRSAYRCLRIHTEGDSVVAVYLMDPVNTPRWGEAIEVIWEKPANQN